MLANEPKLKGTDLYFVLNRVYNLTHVDIVKKMVTDAGHKWVCIPFVADEYRKFQPMDTFGLRPHSFDDTVVTAAAMRRFERQNSNLYLMNNNGARNVALEHGLAQGYAWTLPFDGNCFFDSDAWFDISRELKKARAQKKSYVAFPLVRTQFGADGRLERGDPGEHNVAFYHDALLKFNPLAMYGFRPKVDLLWRLNVPGSWTSWPQSLFDTTRRCEIKTKLLDSTPETREKYFHNKFPTICQGPRQMAQVNHEQATLTHVSENPVLRLPDIEHMTNDKKAQTGEDLIGIRTRGQLRATAIDLRISLVDHKDLQVRERAHVPFKGVKPLYFNVASMEVLRRMYLVGEENIETKLVDGLLKMADDRIDEKEFSVADKGLSHIEGVDAHHYQNVALYDWRACDMPKHLFESDTLLAIATGSRLLSSDVTPEQQQDCKLFLRWDGKVHPGGELFSEGSDLYDRTRSWAFHSNVTMYALAYYYTNDPKYAEKGMKLIRRWWLDPATAMRPTMEYVSFNRVARFRSFGFIELKDLSWALDATHLFMQSPLWTNADSEGMKKWCGDYWEWVSTSFIKKTEAKSKNNHGWYYTLQAAAVRKCAGHSDADLVAMFTEKLTKYVTGTGTGLTFGPRGDLPQETLRTRGVHYHYFTLYGMILAWRAGDNLGLPRDQTPFKEMEDGIFKVVTMLQDPQNKMRLELKDDDHFSQAELQERASVVCAWLRDVTVSRRTLDPKRLATMCDNVPRPPLVPTDPHSGLYPFSHFMF
jgi:hypothetical protein